jgi:LysM repeat protein
MKRAFVLALVVLATVVLSACTRDKPDVVVPTPAATVVVKVDTSTPVPGGLVTPSAVTTPVATEIVTPTVVIPTITPSTGGLPSSGGSTVITGTTGTCPTVYTVQFGDTLNRISSKYGVSVAGIVTANPGLNPNFISVGQTLNIPCSEQNLPPSAFPTAGPMPTPGAVNPTPPVGTPVPPVTTCQPTYTVQRGDWTYAIARRFGISVQALMAANPSINVNYLYPGQVLNIPCGASPVPVPGPIGKTYVVQPGDTLFSIAVRFNTTVYAIQIANNLSNPNFLYVGQTLILP